MNAKELIKTIYDNGGFFNLEWFIKKFNIERDDAISLINFCIEENYFYEIRENEWGLKFNTEELYRNSLNYESTPQLNDHLRKLENFLVRFFSDREIKKKIIEIFLDKKHLAEQFIKIEPLYYDRNKIWWRWNNIFSKWEMIDETDLLNLISKVSKANTIKAGEKGEILEALRQVSRENKPKDAKPTWVQFKNRIYDIENDEEFYASSEFFITNPINWNLGNKEDTPVLDSLFKSWVGEEHIIELYEILGFCIVPSYFIHRLFCLIGSGANGKSTFLKILEKFIGLENISSSSLDLLLKERFEGGKLLKKLVCLIGETNFNILSNTDFLKKLTGEDLVRCEFKGKDSFDFRNYAKLIMATNSLPPTIDKTEGFYRRWKIIDFPNKFTEEKDILSTIPEQEYENLALKCLKISKRLWKERVFTNDGTFEERRKAYEEHSNPITKFIEEEYEKDINSAVRFKEFFNSFNEFLKDRGFRILSSTAVSRLLRNEGYEIKLQTRNGINSSYIFGLKSKRGYDLLEPEENPLGVL